LAGAPAPVALPPVAAAQPEKPKPAARNPKAAAKKPDIRVAKAAAPSAELKRTSGLKYNDLMTAVLYRDADGVSELLKLGKWADKPDSRGATPLMVAAELGDVRTAEALLRGGANASVALPAAEERANGEMLELLKRYTKR
jgi:ankyrin repeat protein